MNRENEENIGTSDSPNSESENESVTTFLSNLLDLGTLCTLTDVGNVEDKILAGMIIKIGPFKSNREIGGPNVIVFTLKSVYEDDDEIRKEFLVFFFKKAARIISEVQLNIGDYLAVHKPRRFHDSTYSSLSSRVPSNPVLIVGIPVGNQIEDIYSKKKSVTNWHKVSECTRIRRLSVKRQHNVAFADDNQFTGREENNEQEVEEMFGSLDICSRLHALTPDNFIANPRIFRSSPRASTSKENRNQEIVEEGSTVVRTFLNDAVRTTAVHSPLNTETVRLKYIRKNMNVTVFGIIVFAGKNPVMTSNNRYYTKLEIADETKEKFPINIYTKSAEAMPTFRLYDIIKLTNMRIVATLDQLCGKVDSARNIVTYSRQNPSIIYQQSQSYECSDEDRERVKELILWMQNNLPEARMFTPICDIKTISTSVNLLGKVKQKKLFDNSKNILLRFEDGTHTTEHFYNYDLTKDVFGPYQEGTSSVDSDFVDIVIIEADSTFRRKIEALAIDSHVQLFGVRVQPQPYTYKTINRCAIKLFFKAVHDNLKLVGETQNQVITDVENEVQPEKNVRITRRKLFNVDESITLHPLEEVRPVSNAGKESEPVPQCRMLNGGETNNINPREEVRSVSGGASKEGESMPECRPCCVAVPRLIEVPSTLQSNTRERRENDQSSAALDLQKTLTENCYLKAMQIQKSIENGLTRDTVENDVQFECYVKWPVDDEGEFWANVSWISTIPVITKTSSDTDLLALVSAHCERCRMYVPFFFISEWINDGHDYHSLCPLCKEKGDEVLLQFLMMAELLIRDLSGKDALAIVVGSNAEKFFGCTISQFCTSPKAQLRVRKLIENTTTLTLKLKLLETNARCKTYSILDRR